MINEYEKGKPVRLSEHFTSTEFDCHCNYPDCQITYIDSDLIKFLEDHRPLFNLPIKITSGFRCVQHNREQGGKKGSIHLIGKAADIKYAAGDRSIVKDSFYYQDADGLGIYNIKGFIHVDLRGYKARWTG